MSQLLQRQGSGSEPGDRPDVLVPKAVQERGVPTTTMDPELAARARAYRLANTDLGPESFRLNVAVIKYERDGKVHYEVAANDPAKLHSESVALKKIEKGDPLWRRTRILQVYSERQPCFGCAGDLRGARARVKVDFPVYYSVPRWEPKRTRARELMARYLRRGTAAPRPPVVPPEAKARGKSKERVAVETTEGTQPKPPAPEAKPAPPTPEEKLRSAASKRAGKTQGKSRARADIATPGQTVSYNPQSPPKYAKRSSGQRAGRLKGQAAGVLVQGASSWLTDVSLNHAVAKRILKLWPTVESWREKHPQHLIVVEVWIQESNVARDGLVQRNPLEVNAYHGATREDIERKIENAGRLTAPPDGMHAVGPYMGWIEPHQDLDDLKEKVAEEECFIATACCGSPDASEVVALRSFRDRCLQPHSAGRAFIRAYYRLSPRPARFLARHSRLRGVVRGLIVAPLARAVDPVARPENKKAPFPGLSPRLRG